MPNPDLPPSSLRVGHVPGVTPTKWRRIWAERFPRVRLTIIEVDAADQRAALVDGRVDMCFVRLPVDREGLHAISLWDEIAVVMAPKDHPIAAFDAVTLADLAAEPLVDPAAPDADSRVAWEQGLLRVPQSVARGYSRKDLIYRPITDAPATTIALAWLIDNELPLIEEFVGIVRGRSADSSRTAAARAASARDTPAEAAPPKPAPRPSATKARRPFVPRRPSPRRRGR